MKYIIQFEIILAISLVGEVLNRIIPLPIPASIYGMIILFAALCAGIIKLSMVREAGKCLIFLMPLMFVSPAVGLIENWGVMKEFLLAIVVISLVSTVAVMAATGHITQFIIKKKEREGKL
ncbi:MAG: CidA/LrgA family protein [Bacteroidaceae bacterium]|nr:CidA/LrgA family protein [Bacteroidaceae bacterium]MBQ8542302.1 CidA/LrgA family protein [Bacteroidaceae bacterium]